MSALIFADDRPTSCDDDLYQWAMDAEALIRNLHTENTALRVTEENLRQELQECQDQRRAAFRRIEELERKSDQDDETIIWQAKEISDKTDKLEGLERQLEEARAVLKDTGLLLHHFWCDVNMNDYSFEKLSKGMEAIDAAMQKGQS